MTVLVPDNMFDNGTQSIIDLNGSVVLRQKAKSNTEKININKLNKGVYLLKINDGKNAQSVKIVKQ